MASTTTYSLLPSTPPAIIMVTGAKPFLNGLYELQPGLVDNQPAYRRMADSADKGMWLSHARQSSQWWFTDSPHLGQAQGFAYCDARDQVAILDGATSFTLAAFTATNGMTSAFAPADLAVATGLCTTVLAGLGLLFMRFIPDGPCLRLLPCDGLHSWKALDGSGKSFIQAPGLTVRRVASPSDFSPLPPPLLLEANGAKLRSTHAAACLGRFEPVLTPFGACKLVHHMPLYKHADLDRTWLRLSAMGTWLVQQGDDEFCEDEQRAFFALADPACKLPHLSSATWKVWSGCELKDEVLVRAVPAPTQLPALTKKRAREGDGEGEGDDGRAKAVKSEPSAGGGGVAEAQDDLEVTGTSTAAQKSAAAQAEAMDLDKDDDE